MYSCPAVACDASESCLFQFKACRLQIFLTLGSSRLKLPTGFETLQACQEHLYRPAKVTDCTVTLPAWSVSHHIVWKSIFGTSQILVTDRPM